MNQLYESLVWTPFETSHPHISQPRRQRDSPAEHRATRHVQHIYQTRCWWRDDESVQKLRGIDVHLSSPSGKQLWNWRGRITWTLQAYLTKKSRLSHPLFKNRKYTVDAGKMWPDCNGRLSYFNLRAVSTFFCDLLRSLMDCKPSVSPPCAQPSKHTQTSFVIETWTHTDTIPRAWFPTDHMGLLQSTTSNA